MSEKWTQEQFWEYVEGLTGDFKAGQMREMLAERGLSLAAPCMRKPFGHFYWKSNGDGTESPDFCEGDVPPYVRVVRGLTPLYTSSDGASGCPRKCGEATDSAGSGNDRNCDDTMQGSRPAAVVKVPPSDPSSTATTAEREALRNVRAAIMEADPAVLCCTLWMPNRISPAETVVDHIDAALSAAPASAWQPSRDDMAKVIDPSAWVSATNVSHHRILQHKQADALAKADAILALAPPRNDETSGGMQS
ncbi:hypothetical protein [Tardiphaga sp. 839_C3_N1_4]|uniref:hypothetical protein n=1 Tax=Tardiphaga sp. 839_C3_N1_4 TaxID=3240761 RepID=UPI003F21218E